MDRERERGTDGWTDRQTDRQTDIQTDRHTDDQMALPPTRSERRSLHARGTIHLHYRRDVTYVLVAIFRFLYYKQANRKKPRGKVSPFVTSKDKKRNGPVLCIQYRASNPLTIASWTFNCFLLT